jgi:hypothetical protein
MKIPNIKLEKLKYANRLLTEAFYLIDDIKCNLQFDESIPSCVDELEDLTEDVGNWIKEFEPTYENNTHKLPPVRREGYEQGREDLLKEIENKNEEECIDDAFDKVISIIKKYKKQ